MLIKVCKNKYYEKNVASDKVMGAKTAMSDTSKMATLCQETIQGMSNTGRDIKIEERIKIMKKYMTKLHNSRYSE